MPSRLFEAVTQQQIHFPKNMLSYKKDKVWKHWSSGVAQEQINNLSVGLFSHGLSTLIVSSTVNLKLWIRL